MQQTGINHNWHFMDLMHEYIDHLVQYCSNSSALTMELPQSWTKPWYDIYVVDFKLKTDWWQRLLKSRTFLQKRCNLGQVMKISVNWKHLETNWIWAKHKDDSSTNLDFSIHAIEDVSRVPTLYLPVAKSIRNDNNMIKITTIDINDIKMPYVLLLNMMISSRIWRKHLCHDISTQWPQRIL